MFRPAQGLLALSLLVLMGCGGQPTTPPAASPEASPPTVASPEPVAQAPSTTDPALETTVYPGRQFGPVTDATTREDLATLFGEANLTDEAVGVGEGETEPGTVVNLDGDRSFTVIWRDASRTKPLLVRDVGSAWKTPEGIGVGMTFDELQQQLGAFQLYGFGWDYGGTVVLEGTNLAEHYGELIIRTKPSQTAIADHASDYEAVIGDRLYPASDPHFQPLDITVDSMIVYLSQQ